MHTLVYVDRRMIDRQTDNQQVDRMTRWVAGGRPSILFSSCTGMETTSRTSACSAVEVASPRLDSGH